MIKPINEELVETVFRLMHRAFVDYLLYDNGIYDDRNYIRRSKDLAESFFYMLDENIKANKTVSGFRDVAAMEMYLSARVGTKDYQELYGRLNKYYKATEFYQTLANDIAVYRCRSKKCKYMLMQHINCCKSCDEIYSAQCVEHCVNMEEGVLCVNETDSASNS